MTPLRPTTDDSVQGDPDPAITAHDAVPAAVDGPTSPRFEPLLRAAAVAEILDVTERTLRRYAARGLLRPIKMGGAVRYRADAVFLFMSSDRQET